MIKAIVFDVDGTLSNNVSALIRGWKRFARQMKLKPPTAQEVKDFLGIPYYEISPQMWPGFNPYENADKFRAAVEYFRKDMKTVISRQELLKLKKKYKIGIVTSARRNNLNSYIGDILDVFDVIITPEDTKKHKPDPEPMRICCEKLKLKPEEVLYTGDTMFDFLSARGAGTKFVGVLTGVGTIKYFKKLGTPYIKSVKTIGKYADDLNEQ